MKLSQLPCNTIFTVIRPNEKMPLFHKGEDGKVRKIVGSCGGWAGFCTFDLNEEEENQLTQDTEIQRVYISPPISYASD